MRFDEHFLDEIKSRLRLSDVIGRSVKLRRQGREYAGLSPFTQEKTPSFYVNDEKGFYHCFSSGKHGDLISFLQETERLSFPEAVERLAAEAGVPMPVPDARSAAEDKKRLTLMDWLEAAAVWFEGELRRPGGQAARAYLDKRGLPDSEWARFRLGLAPASRTGLKDHLVQKGARPAELVEAGLLIAPEDGGAPYDRFRERIIFPITDARGRVISFGGRALNAEAKAKYLNGPDTALFDKGRTLYGLYEARKLLAAGGEDAPLVAVEGYMDVIACQRAGIAAVAGMGTALTEDQMALMWRYHPEPTLCFDGDGAGQRAASRAMDRALPLLQPGRSFRFALVTGGKDPDDVLREQGPAALKAQMSQTTPFVQTLFLRERDLEPLDTPERRSALKARLRKLAAIIQDKDLAQAYRDDLLARLDAFFAARSPSPQQQRKSFARGFRPEQDPNFQYQNRPPQSGPPSDPIPKQEEAFITACLFLPSYVLENIEDVFKADEYLSHKAKDILLEYLNALGEAGAAGVIDITKFMLPSMTAIYGSPGRVALAASHMSERISPEEFKRYISVFIEVYGTLRERKMDPGSHEGRRLLSRLSTEFEPFSMALAGHDPADSKKQRRW